MEINETHRQLDFDINLEASKQYLVNPFEIGIRGGIPLQYDVVEEITIEEDINILELSKFDFNEDKMEIITDTLYVLFFKSIIISVCYIHFNNEGLYGDDPIIRIFETIRKHRDQGFGSKLMQHIKNDLLFEGHQIIHVLDILIKSRNFYRKHGFKIRNKYGRYNLRDLN